MSEPTIAQVDAAVRAVLSGRSGAGRGPGASFAGRLLTFRHVQAWDSSEREIRVGVGTVVSPMARDELKRRGITVRVVADVQVGIDRVEGEWGFAIDPGSGWLEAVRRGLLSGSEGWSEIGRSAEDVSKWIIQASHRGAALLTIESALACWWANRIDGVRAATVSGAEEVPRAVRSLGMNLAVIDPTSKSIPSLRHLLKTFRKLGAAHGTRDTAEGPDFAGRID